MALLISEYCSSVSSSTRQLGLDDYDLGGYSMGGKLVLRLLARGARPAHAVVGGQGLDALDAESDRTAGHRRILAAIAGGVALPAGSPPEEATAEWIRNSGFDPQAVGLVLGTFVATAAAALQPVSAPTLIVVGGRDSRGTSAGSLAALLPHGQLVVVPGDHVTALGAPEFTAAVLEFLGKSLPANASR
jgi:pimeloyl-ACP methyl ester carboxylesterase